MASSAESANASSHRQGFWLGFGAYSLWGLFPLYWPLLEPSGALEILAHRMVWSLAAVALTLLVLRRWSWIPKLLREPKRLALITVAALVISVNWGLYIWGVNNGHVVETSMGYFINPLITIGCGVVILHERLRPVQWCAVAIGAISVVVLTVAYGRLPWIALTLAFAFASYGLIKKKLNLGGIESLAAETAVMFLPALTFLLVLTARGDGTFGTVSPGHSLLLAGAGVVTSLPLALFGLAAARVPLSLLGLLQYLAPIFQFVLGLSYFHEEMAMDRWAGFILVWLALAVLTWDGFRNARRMRQRAATFAATPEVTSVGENAAQG